MHKSNPFYVDIERATAKMSDEIQRGLAMLNTVKVPLIGVYGSHRIAADTVPYKLAYDFGHASATRGHGIITGGGPGIMQAANKGALDADGVSVGLKVKSFGHEVVEEDIYTHKDEFSWIFARRFLLGVKCEALVFFPGGYGTLSELFEYLVLMHTKMSDTVPVYCVGKEYWQGLYDWLDDKTLGSDYLPGGKVDIELVKTTDYIEEIFEELDARRS